MNAECKVVIAVLFTLYCVKMAKPVVKFLHDLMPQFTSYCRTKIIHRLLQNYGKDKVDLHVCRMHEIFVISGVKLSHQSVANKSCDTRVNDSV